MLYALFLELSTYFSPLQVARYISFRAIMALLMALALSLALSPWFIQRLRRRQIKQQVRDDGPKSHLSKAGTPTMGGGLILFAALMPAWCWMDLSIRYLWYVSIITITFGAIGFLDDYLKIYRKNPRGLAGRYKLIGQFSITLALLTWHYHSGVESGNVHLPFLKDVIVPLGWWYVPFAALVIVGASNAVNLTDGLDGLAIGPVMTTACTLGILAYVSGNYILSQYLNYPFLPGTGELAIFSACIVGAGLGFLWYNTYPAQVFMGDVGSLPLGGVLGSIAVFTKHELILALVGAIFVVEALSVMAQVGSFKLRGKRVLKMAPIHHHFELSGLPEPKVIVRFWIVSIVLALLGLLTLKIR